MKLEEKKKKKSASPNTLESLAMNSEQCKLYYISVLTLNGNSASRERATLKL